MTCPRSYCYFVPASGWASSFPDCDSNAFLFIMQFTCCSKLLFFRLNDLEILEWKFVIEKGCVCKIVPSLKTTAPNPLSTFCLWWSPWKQDYTFIHTVHSFHSDYSSWGEGAVTPYWLEKNLILHTRVFIPFRFFSAYEKKGLRNDFQCPGC